MSSGRVQNPAAAHCVSCGRSAGTAAIAACPSCGGAVVVSSRSNAPGLFSLPPVQHPRQYLWFVAVSALDLILTGVILGLGGHEVNMIADAVLVHGGMTALTVFKFALVALVVVFCEWVTRRNARAGFKLAEWSIAITAIPVALSVIQLVT